LTNHDNVECNVTCHAGCAHLVPDFCGMSMEMANRMLREMEAVRRRQRERQPKPQVAPRVGPTPAFENKSSAPYPSGSHVVTAGGTTLAAPVLPQMVGGQVQIRNDYGKSGCYIMQTSD
jgi:hypothetical protein